MFAIFAFGQILAFFLIHPLTVMVVPSILIVYAVLEERKRFKTRYGTSKDRLMNASSGVGSGPEARAAQWDAENAVIQYQKWMEENKEETE